MKSFSMTVSSAIVFPNNFGISGPLDSTPPPEIDVKNVPRTLIPGNMLWYTIYWKNIYMNR